MMVAKNQLPESSTTLPTQPKRLTSQPCKSSPHPRHLLFSPVFPDPLASLSAKRSPMTIRLCRHSIRRPFRPVCFSCTRQRCSHFGIIHSRIDSKESKDSRIDSDSHRGRRSDSSCSQNYQIDGSRVVITGLQGLEVTFELSRTQHALGRTTTTPQYTHSPISDGLYE